MTHPILALQQALVAALRAAIATPVFDAPPQGAALPYITIVRHDVLPRDGDGAPGHEHRLLLHVRAADASRKDALAIVDGVLATALALQGAELAITLARHERTETGIDGRTGRARAAVALTFFTEPR